MTSYYRYNKLRQYNINITLIYRKNAKRIINHNIIINNICNLYKAKLSFHKMLHPLTFYKKWKLQLAKKHKIKSMCLVITLLNITPQDRHHLILYRFC